MKNIFLYSPQKEKCNNAIIAITSAVPCIEYYKKKLGTRDIIILTYNSQVNKRISIKISIKEFQ